MSLYHHNSRPEELEYDLQVMKKRKVAANRREELEYDLQVMKKRKVAAIATTLAKLEPT